MEQSRRGQIIEMLKADPHSFYSLAQLLGVPLKVVEEDLQHIEKSIVRTHKLKQIPPECENCGFVFEKRSRFTKPSRCPKCKSEHILDGMVQIIERSNP